MKQFRLSSRHLRATIALACFVLAGLVVILHLLNVSTSDAVLDGRRVVLRAQISGQVAGLLPSVGTLVKQGDVVVVVQASASDARGTRAAQADRQEVEAKISALDLEHDQLVALQRGLAIEVGEYNSAMVDTVKAQIVAAQAAIEVAQSDYQVAHQEADRARRMTNTGGMGQSDIDRRLGDEASTERRLEGVRAEHAQLTVEINAFGLGINPLDGQNNVPYSRQRLDEISIKLADITNQRSALVARDKGLQNEIARENDWLMSQARSESVAAGPSVIWRRPVAVGTDVSKGDVLVELVDCSDMFVNARIPADKASVIALGDEVDVVIAGYDSAVPGKVRIVRSLAATDPHGSDASGLQAPGVERWAEVEIAVSRGNLVNSGGNFCGIGSGARVRFPVRSIFSSLLPKF